MPVEPFSQPLGLDPFELTFEGEEQRYGRRVRRGEGARPRVEFDQVEVETAVRYRTGPCDRPIRRYRERL
jgi:hypothetical protein